MGLEDDDDNFDGDLAAKTGTIDGAMMIKTTATPRLDYQSVYLPSSTVLLRLVAERFPWDRARHVVASDKEEEEDGAEANKVDERGKDENNERCGDDGRRCHDIIAQ